ncbi:hypothetical protein F4808DRAFT_233762 [Astrocystis sublimbata]|nr:hypothetical protein F4808DRAFT_233762 [Astrocystis sublimbata]
MSLWPQDHCYDSKTPPTAFLISMSCHIFLARGNTEVSAHSMRQCITCIEDLPEWDFVSASSRCILEHRSEVCVDCVARWIEQTINDRHTRVSCPQCSIELDYFEIRDATDDATFKTYEALLLSTMLEKEPYFEWCAHNCGSGQLHPAAEAEPIMTCHYYHRRTCVVHGLPWHSGFTCEQFDQLVASSQQAGIFRQCTHRASTTPGSRRSRSQGQRFTVELEAAVRGARDDEASREEVRRTSKLCPQCRIDIEKISGCDRMKCGRCNHSFCWSCLAPHDMIDKLGNSSHMRECHLWRA